MTLLFDDVMWASKAKEEHDAFAEALRDKGVLVHYYGQLLAETLELPDGRAFVLDRLCTPEILGPSLVGPVRRLFEDLDGTTLAESLVGGVLKADLHPLPDAQPQVGHAPGRRLHPRPAAQPPLSRGTTRAGSTAGVTINPMAMPARQRETPAHPGHLPLPSAVRRQPTSSPTTAARTATTSRPPSRAATSTSSATGPS